MSSFGGPHDGGVAKDEGLALYDHHDIAHRPDLFLAEQPHGTTGVARRLDPNKSYIAMRWHYPTTSRNFLRNHKVIVTSIRTGESVEAQPVDWGPNEDTGRIADLSPGILNILKLNTDDTVRVTVPLP